MAVTYLIGPRPCEAAESPGPAHRSLQLAALGCGTGVHPYWAVADGEAGLERAGEVRVSLLPLTRGNPGAGSHTEDPGDKSSAGPARSLKEARGWMISFKDARANQAAGDGQRATVAPERRSAGALETGGEGKLETPPPGITKSPPLLREGRDSLMRGHLNLWATPRRRQLGNEADHIPLPTHDGAETSQIAGFTGHRGRSAGSAGLLNSQASSPSAAGVTEELVTGLTAPGWLQSSSKRSRVAVERNTSTCSCITPGVTASCRCRARPQAKKKHRNKSLQDYLSLCHVAQCLRHEVSTFIK